MKVTAIRPDPPVAEVIVTLTLAEAQFLKTYLGAFGTSHLERTYPKASEKDRSVVIQTAQSLFSHLTNEGVDSHDMGQYRD